MGGSGARLGRPEDGFWAVSGTVAMLVFGRSNIERQARITLLFLAYNGQCCVRPSGMLVPFKYTRPDVYRDGFFLFSSPRRFFRIQFARSRRFCRVERSGVTRVFFSRWRAQSLRY